MNKRQLKKEYKELLRKWENHEIEYSEVEALATDLLDRYLGFRFICETYKELKGIK